MSSMPLENLHIQAIEQRNRLHKTAEELRTKVDETKDKLRVDKQARDHFLGASIIAAVVGFGVGYLSGGMFTGN
jgi:hypothetical protein